MGQDEGYQQVGSVQRHWLWRAPEHGWQVGVLALLAAVVFAGAGYLVGRNGVSAVTGAIVFGLIFGGRGAWQLRRSNRG